MTNHTKSVSTIERTLDILTTIKEMEGARVTEIAEELEFSKSTVHRHLKTLENRKYVAQRGDEYVIGLRFIDLGAHAKSRTTAYRMANSKVDEIAEYTDERAQFLVEEHGKAVYVHCAKGRSGVETDPGVGKSVPLHATAAGKCILAHLSSDRRREILDQNSLSKMTKHTITDRGELFGELDNIRERGYSLNDQESTIGLRAVGVPILSPTSNPVGALSVSGPVKRMVDDRFEVELPGYLMGIANELELNIYHT